MPKNHRSYQKTRHIALSGLLFALAMALSFIEGTLVIPGLLPGMKLGLANIVVMYALFFMGPRQALVLDVLKALFVFLVSGFTAGFLSLCGGLLSLAVMWVLYYLLHGSSCRSAAHWHITWGSCWARESSSPRPCRCTTRRSCWCWGLSWVRSPRSPCGRCCPRWAKWASTPTKTAPNDRPFRQGSCILAGNLYNKETTVFLSKRPQRIALPQHGNSSGSREVFVYV